MALNPQNIQADKKGFTLVELLIVITVMSILGVAAASSYFNSTATFAFLANMDGVTSVFRTARSYALTNKAVDNGGMMETPDRYGVYVDTDEVFLFADNGPTPLLLDPDPKTGDFFIGDKNFDFSDPDNSYEILGIDFAGEKINNPLVIFFDTGSGEVTVFEDLPGGYEILSKKENPVIRFRFRDVEEDIERFIVFFSVTGLTEEFMEI